MYPTAEWLTLTFSDQSQTTLLLSGLYISAHPTSVPQNSSPHISLILLPSSHLPHIIAHPQPFHITALPTSISHHYTPQFSSHQFHNISIPNSVPNHFHIHTILFFPHHSRFIALPGYSKNHLPQHISPGSICYVSQDKFGAKVAILETNNTAAWVTWFILTRFIPWCPFWQAKTDKTFNTHTLGQRSYLYRMLTSTSPL